MSFADILVDDAWRRRLYVNREVKARADVFEIRGTTKAIWLIFRSRLQVDSDSTVWFHMKRKGVGARRRQS